MGHKLYQEQLITGQLGSTAGRREQAGTIQTQWRDKKRKVLPSYSFSLSLFLAAFANTHTVRVCGCMCVSTLAI